MSDESRMNPDLKKLEAELGRMAIPAAAIDRDQMMYQSGWAAATASIQNDASVAESFSRSNRRSWVWPTTAILTSAASILLGALLLIQTGEPPSLMNSQPVAQRGKPQEPPTQDNSDSSWNIDRTEVESLPTADEEYGDSDILKMVLEIPAGQVLKSGLSFQEAALTSNQFPRNVDRPDVQGLEEISVGHRKLLQEFLPTRQRGAPAWSSLFF